MIEVHILSNMDDPLNGEIQEFETFVEALDWLRLIGAGLDDNYSITIETGV